MNQWQSHFDLWKRLREPSRWHANPRMAALCELYHRSLSSRLAPPELEAAEAILRKADGGKHCAYQRIWGWNALAFQKIKFQDDPDGARACLERSLEVTEGISGNSYSGQGPCVEAVWLILLLNIARIDFLRGNDEQGRRRLTGLRGYLREKSMDPELFGQAFSRGYKKGTFRFSFQPQLRSFLEQKLIKEDARWIR